MCFFVYSNQGEIELDVTETIYFHPRFFTEFGGVEDKGRTTILSEVFITVKKGNIDSIKLLYPNITNYFEDLSTYPNAWSDFKNEWDDDTTEVGYTLSPSYEEDIFREVLKRIPTEVKTVTFSKTLKPGMKVPLYFLIESPNAVHNRVTLEGAFIGFDISGPYNVVRTFETGLDGATDTFKYQLENQQTDADVRAAYQAALDVTNQISATLYSEVTCANCCVKSWKFVLVFDPRLSGITTDSSGLKDISKFGSPDDVDWDFDLPLYYRLNPFATNKPGVRSFVFIDETECDSHQDADYAKFEISGNAQMSKPTMYILTWIALIITWIGLILTGLSFAF